MKAVVLLIVNKFEEFCVAVNSPQGKRKIFANSPIRTVLIQQGRLF
jgi:hypothetical protein